MNDTYEREIIINRESEGDALKQIRTLVMIALGGESVAGRYRYWVRRPRRGTQGGGRWDASGWMTRYEELDLMKTGRFLVQATANVFDGGSSLHIPMNWFSELQRTYRGQERPYHEAILLLSYIVMRYRRGLNVDPTGLLFLHHEVDSELGLTTDQRKHALRYLEEKGLVQRVVIRGLVTWWPLEERKAGSYLFVIPQFAALAKITHDPDIETAQAPAF